MEETRYTKLSALVGGQMTIESVGGYKFKMWIPEESRMHVSDTYEEGHRKVYQVITNKGTLDISQSQMGSLLEGVVETGRSDIIGKTFEIKSNGKTGMEIRYFINPVREKQTEIIPDKQIEDRGDDSAKSEYPEGFFE